MLSLSLSFSLSLSLSLTLSLSLSLLLAIPPREHIPQERHEIGKRRRHLDCKVGNVIQGCFRPLVSCVCVKCVCVGGLGELVTDRGRYKYREGQSKQ